MHDNPAEELAEIFGVEIPDYLIDAIEESDDPMFFADIFLNDFICDSQLHGILIKAETPMKKDESAVPGTTVATCNWGAYRSKWIYCESTADIARKLTEFAG